MLGLGNTFCRGFISGLLSQGAAGKTAVRITQALALATGRPLTGEHVFQRARVLIVCLEDTLDELRRRVRAARLHHGVTTEEVRDWLFYWAPAGLKLIMLIIGGVGRLYGAFIGVPLYLVAQDRFSSIDPVYWYFWIGLLMVGLVSFARGGVLGLGAALWPQRPRPR